MFCVLYQVFSVKVKLSVPIYYVLICASPGKAIPKMFYYVLSGTLGDFTF